VRAIVRRDNDELSFSFAACSSLVVTPRDWFVELLANLLPLRPLAVASNSEDTRDPFSPEEEASGARGADDGALAQA